MTKSQTELEDSRQEGQEGSGHEGDGAGQTAPEGEPSGDVKGQPKYTDDDVDEIVKKRLARERAQIEREVRKKLETDEADRQTEAQRLENMTELQRAQYEAKKLKEEKDALIMERDLSQQTSIARRELAAADIVLGDDLLSMFVSADADKTGKAIDQLKELWPKAVNEAVQRQLKRGSIPQAERGKGATVSFGASFAKQYSASKIPEKNGGK